MKKTPPQLPLASGMYEKDFTEARNDFLRWQRLPAQTDKGAADLAAAGAALRSQQLRWRHMSQPASQVTEFFRLLEANHVITRAHVLTMRFLETSPPLLNDRPAQARFDSPETPRTAWMGQGALVGAVAADAKQAPRLWRLDMATGRRETLSTNAYRDVACDPDGGRLYALAADAAQLDILDPTGAVLEQHPLNCEPVYCSQPAMLVRCSSGLAVLDKNAAELSIISLPTMDLAHKMPIPAAANATDMAVAGDTVWLALMALDRLAVTDAGRGSVRLVEHPALYRPMLLAVHPKTGELWVMQAVYVYSWGWRVPFVLHRYDAALQHLGPVVHLTAQHLPAMRHAEVEGREGMALVNGDAMWFVPYLEEAGETGASEVTMRRLNNRK